MLIPLPKSSYRIFIVPVIKGEPIQSFKQRVINGLNLSPAYFISKEFNARIQKSFKCGEWRGWK